MGSLVAGVYAAFLATIWLAYLTAELGRFRAVPCLLAGLVAGGLVSWFKRRETSEIRGWAPALVVVLGVGGLFLTWPSSELILGGWDPGVYLHTAAALDRGGAIRILEPDLANLPEAVKPVICRTLAGVWEPFAGMRLLPDGRLSPSFHHLYPCLLAVVWKGFGLAGALAVNHVLYIGCLLALFELARRLFGRGWGVLAALLLATNPSQIWQAGFCTSEMLTQLLFLMGFVGLASVLPSQRLRALDAALTGASFGLALLARYDTILVLVPLGLLLLLAWRSIPNRRHLVILLVVLGAFLIHAKLHQRMVAPFYHPVPQLVHLAVVLALSVGAALWLVSQLTWRRLGPWLEARTARFRLLAALALLAWMIFMGLIRPALPQNAPLATFVQRLLDHVRLSDLYPLLAGSEAANLRYLSMILGAPGFVLALGGVLALVLRPRASWQRFWLFPSLAVLLVLVANLFNDHFLMWVARRYVPIVMPLLTLGGVAAAVAIAGWVRARRPAWAPWSGGLVAAVLLGSQLPQLKPVATIRDWPGLTAWYDALAPRIPPRAAVYCDQPGYAAPLRFLYGITAYELQARHANKYQWLGRLLYFHAATGSEVLYLSCTGPIPDVGCAFEPLFAQPLHTSTLNYQRTRFPRDSRERGCDFVLYRVRAVGPAPVLQGGPGTASAP